jgi:hypothetical protein
LPFAVTGRPSFSSPASSGRRAIQPMENGAKERRLIDRMAASGGWAGLPGGTVEGSARMKQARGFAGRGANFFRVSEWSTVVATNRNAVLP